MIPDLLTPIEPDAARYSDLLLLAREAQLAGLHEEASRMRRLIERLAQQAAGEAAAA